MLMLGIETSCDETAAAVVRDGRLVLANAVYSQVADHEPFGGVVPEIASRKHVDILPGIVRTAMNASGTDWDTLDGVAVTYGPGLATSLLIGVIFAKALARRLNRPLIGVNHLEAHLYSLFLDSAGSSNEPAVKPDAVCPMLTLTVSGGHSSLIWITGSRKYHILGQTIDDAAGEALDKGANLLKLGYPGGPAIERTACGGDPARIRFPRGLEQGDDNTWTDGLNWEYCFSFSGLKTALLYYLKKHPDALDDPEMRRDLACSYQEAVVDALCGRVRRVLRDRQPRTLGCVGGVSRNQVLRDRLRAMAAEHSLPLLLADPAFCTDNAAMIAGLAAMLPRDQTGPCLDVQPNLSVAYR